MSKYTFLTQEQFFEEADKLEVIKKRGTKAAITDFSVLLGGYVDDKYHIDGDESLEGRTGWYWTKSDYGTSSARAVADNGDWYYNYVYGRNNGARPALPFSSIDKIPTNGVSGRRSPDGVQEVEFGYYPQKAASKQMQSELERMLNSRKLQRTGNGYTTDSTQYDKYDEKFKPQRHPEYEYNGKRYVRVIANSYFDEFKLSNGEKYKKRRCNLGRS